MTKTFRKTLPRTGGAPRPDVSTPVRVEGELYAAATRTAGLMSRSIGQQISHWARLGRELEASPDVSVERIGRVLEGAASYDDLGPEEQAATRAYWRERMETLRRSLRLDEEFARQGRAYVELDDDGKVVRREPGRAAAEPSR
jgi:hypothetical protein